MRKEALTKRQKNYALLISTVGVIVFYFSFQVTAPYLLRGGLPMLGKLSVMILLIALLRSIPGDYGARRMHAGYGAALAVSLVYDATTAIVAYEASTLLTLIRDRVLGKRHGVLDGTMHELLFGDGVVSISIIVGVTFYRAQTDIGKVFLWPTSIVPACVFFAVAGGIGWTLFSIMLLLGDRKYHKQIGTNLLLLIPSVALSIGCAFVVTMMFKTQGGGWLTLWMVLALLLMRFAMMRLQKARAQYYDIINTLSEAIEARDPATMGHAKRVEACALLIGRTLHLSRERINGLRIASLLLDVGKIGIDDAVLRKDSELDEHEWEDMRKHPQIGHKIIDQVELPARIRDAILHHHERYDGTGYPDGVRLADCPIDDSILSAADAFVAMISDRSFRAAMDAQSALRVLRAESGKQFHPDVVHAFEKAQHHLQMI